MTELTWDAPGPGSWQWDAAHMPGPVSPGVQELLPGAMAEGFQVFTAAYGLPISHIELRFVNGYGYGAVQMGDLASRDVLPPEAAEQAMASRRWREELRWWTEEARPEIVATQHALQSVDCAALDDNALATHLDATAAAFRHSMSVHFRLVGATAIPVGDYLVHCRDWGLPLDDSLALLVGDHPLTAACRPVRDAIGDARPRSLDEVRALSPAASAALDELIDTVGCWGIGRYDFSGRTLGEEPAALLASVLADTPSRPSGKSLRDKVPADERELFDDLLAEALFTFSARDDHAVLGGVWTLGIIRRALLEAASRLPLDSPDQVFQLAPSDVARALRSGADDIAALARERADAFEIASAATPPPVLGEGGFGAGPPPDFVLPGALGRVLAAMGAYMGAMAGAAAPMGIGSGIARGRALVAFDPEDAIDRIQPGDILVTSTTTPAFGAVMPLLGGIVAASGGALSHTAIVARELGIPAVVGMTDAFVRIADGVTIEIDAGAGEVRVIS
ncbi:MAG: rifampicin phosphotransferase [Acidimicrobiaceae bacterium]